LGVYKSGFKIFTRYMNKIAKTGFYISIISYFAFAFFDYLRPGFVSYVFSVHWFLLAAIIFGIIWASNLISEKNQGIIKRIIIEMSKFIIGVILFVIIWREGEVFGDFRILLALIGFLIPWISMKLLRE